MLFANQRVVIDGDLPQLNKIRYEEKPLSFFDEDLLLEKGLKH